jgi:hypothetical protein
VPHLEQLPGLRWKRQNLEPLRKTNARKVAESSDALARLLVNANLSNVACLSFLLSKGDRLP